MIRSMRPMAQTAVFRYRIVLPEKRTALLGVTLVAVLIKCQLVQFVRPRRTVGIMTIAADYLGFLNGVPGSTVGLGTDYRMALITEFGLGGTFQYGIRLVYGMATDTSQILALMNACRPVHKSIALVTLQ